MQFLTIFALVKYRIYRVVIVSKPKILYNIKYRSGVTQSSMSNNPKSFEEVKAKLDTQLVWMAEMPAHTKGWQMIEAQWEKLLSFSPRTDLMRMKLATMKKALEAAERGSISTKEERFKSFFQTNSGRLAWKDFTEGSPGKRVAIMGKGKEEARKK